MSFWATVWAKLRAIGAWVGAKVLAPGVALLLVAGAILLVAMGAKDLQIGGLLARLLGRKGGSTPAIDVTNTVPPGRVDDQGKLIQPGTPDDKGFVQAVVVPITPPGLFSNPNTVEVVPPGQTEPVQIDLPKGVTARDVDKVVVLAPGTFVVSVKDTSPVPTQKLDDLLAKYGG